MIYLFSESCKHVVFKGIAIDERDGRIYVVDTGRQLIHNCNYNGEGCLLITSVPSPRYIDVHSVTGISSVNAVRFSVIVTCQS